MIDTQINAHQEPWSREREPTLVAASETASSRPRGEASMPHVITVDEASCGVDIKNEMETESSKPVDTVRPIHHWGLPCERLSPTSSSESGVVHAQSEHFAKHFPAHIDLMVPACHVRRAESGP